MPSTKQSSSLGLLTHTLFCALLPLIMQTLLFTRCQTINLICLLSQLTLAYQSHAMSCLTLLLLTQTGPQPSRPCLRSQAKGSDIAVAWLHCSDWQPQCWCAPAPIAATLLNSILTSTRAVLLLGSETYNWLSLCKWLLCCLQKADMWCH